MQSMWTSVVLWLAQTALGGTLVLLLVLGWMRLLRQPARRQRLGETGLAAAFLAGLAALGPTWLPLPWIPFQRETSHEVGQTDERSGQVEVKVGAFPMPPDLPFDLVTVVETDPRFEWIPSEPPSNEDFVGSPHWMSRAMVGLCAFYGLGVLFFLGRAMNGYRTLRRILKEADAAPEEIRKLVPVSAGATPPRLLMSSKLRVPVSCGIWNPTIVLPVDICKPPDGGRLPWVFAHEMTHLVRRDAWSGLLFALGQAMFFYLPWFWWLRRQVRLCQEYVADAAAAQVRPADEYAEFLLSLIASPPVPMAAHGVSGNSSDLYRRVSMLLKSPTRVEQCCPRTWTVASAALLLALALVLGGIGLTAEAGGRIIIIEPPAKAPAEVAKPAPGGHVPGGPVRILLEKSDGNKDVFFFRDGEFKDWLKKKPDVLFGKPFIIELKAGKPGEKTQEPKEIQEWLKMLEKVGAHKDGDAYRKAVEELLKQGKGGRFEIEIEMELKLDDEKNPLKNKIFFDKKVPFEFDKLVPHQPTQVPLTPELLQKLLEKMKVDGQVDPEVMRQIELVRAGKPGGLFVTGTGSSLRLGAKLVKPSEIVAEQLNLAPGQGLVVAAVDADSPAAKVGLKVNDILIKVNGSPIASDPAKFAQQLASMKPETPIEFVLIRKGKEEALKTMRREEIILGGAQAVDPLQLSRLKEFNKVFNQTGEGVMTTTFRNGDRFNTRHQEGSLIITVLGKTEAGKAVAQEIHVQDGTVANKYDSLDRVPAQYRDKVGHLLQISGGTIQVK